jgi:ABC-type branched-subunit amino acid transport system ATPase component
LYGYRTRFWTLRISSTESPRDQQIKEIGAPVIVKEIYAEFRRVTANRTTLVIVEQDIRQAMAVSDRVYCMREGRIVLMPAF